jgi:hypothetical protein
MLSSLSLKYSSSSGSGSSCKKTCFSAATEALLKRMMFLRLLQFLSSETSLGGNGGKSVAICEASMFQSLLR